MPRKKKYNEDEVVLKAMYLFWKNGYENTSMQMLENEMGINKFSIYASFGNKHGLFIACIKSYKESVNSIFKKLEKSKNGIESIKQFFKDSVDIRLKNNIHKGCLITNTYNEFYDSEDKLIKDQMNSFINNLKKIFIEKLRTDVTKDEKTIQKQANFLLLSKHGLAAAARVNTENEINDYIEMIFKNI